MARDSALTLVEVQTILWRAHLSTTARYTAVRLDAWQLSVTGLRQRGTRIGASGIYSGAARSV
ncbi:hypothetical protein ACWD3I_40945 [Streptomyces sp. NPDC002817]|uniref:hypothetical protein n=1 Tax=Streptomyces sp. NPDC088357 TaxID=3154655 RepID=UPI003424F2C3